MRYYIKIHKKREDAITAICDEEIIGKRFDEGDIQLEVSERFYNGRLIGDDAAADEMNNARILNITGKNIINLALKKGVIKKSNILQVQRIPHAEVC